ncbi:MAG: extracellular solute-binding protein [Candidatus Izemoplasmatales bacterium]|nr:extracellular solute-binding protein [Candidatus Izemoplasmatales bacterium]MDY0139769.1 extracellular solute-binding protein [Candidatus Izemoplasmatales bacterium]
MKKMLSLFLFTLLVLGFVGCQSTSSSTTGNSSTTTDNSGSASSSTQTTEMPDPVTITYAAWNLGAVDSVNLERLMLEAFEEEYPWITVEIIERPKVTDPSGTSEIDQNWNEFLGARASRGTLPDVYFTDSVETTIMNSWSRDMSDIAYDDPEFMNVSEDLREAANFNGKLMALPYAVYYFGYFINTSLFEEQNGDVPVFDDTFPDFLDKVSDIANQNVTNGTGIAGVVGIDRMLEWYPAQLNPNLGWYTYDGIALNLDSEEFEDTLDLYTSLMQNKSLIYDALTPEEQMAAFGTPNTWESNQLAAFFNYTPIIGSMTDLGFDVDFIGTPGTDAAHQIPVILDLICVSSTTANPEAAYLLAKWMSFGAAGYLKRIELSTTVEGVEPLNMTPLQPNEELLDAFFAIYPTFVEFRKVVAHSSFVIEPNKYVPGYIKARWNADFDAERTVGDIFDLVRSGQLNYADVKTSWNDIANNELSKAISAVYERLGVEPE